MPAASPSSFTTYGGPNPSSAAAASAGVEQVRDAAVGTPAAAITSLANAFEPSIRAAAALGPKQAIPAARTASAAPATSGDLGTDHHQVGPDLGGQRGDRGRVADRQRPLLGDHRRAGVAGRADQRGHRRVGRERQAERVLAGTAADDQNPHGREGTGPGHDGRAAPAGAARPSGVD